MPDYVHIARPSEIAARATAGGRPPNRINDAKYYVTKLLNLKGWNVGGGMFVVGIACILLSLPISGWWEHCFYDAGFHVAAAGLVVVFIEPRMRKESQDFMQVSIRDTIESVLVEPASPFQGNLIASLQKSPEAVGAAVATAIDKNLGDVKHLFEAAERENIRDFLSTLFPFRELEEELAEEGDEEEQEDDNEDVQKLGAHIGAIIVSLRSLHPHRTRWADDAAYRYLSKVLRNVADNANNLSEFCNSAESIEPKPHRITLYSPAYRTNAILKRLMRYLKSGDSYSVVSDVTSWTEDKLRGFFRNHLGAARRGITIRRVFVLSADDVSRSKWSSTYHILHSHIRTSEQLKSLDTGYKVRLLDTTSPASPRLPPALGDISKKHFGIFACRDQHSAIKVSVEEGDLSLFDLAKIPLTSPDFARFETFWELLGEDLDLDALEKLRVRWGGT